MLEMKEFVSSTLHNWREVEMLLCCKLFVNNSPARKGLRGV